MHTDKHFAERWCGSANARTRRRRSSAESATKSERVHTLTSIIKAMARFFWFTIEFGLMRSPDGPARLRQRPAQLLRRDRARIESPDVQRFPIQLEWAINQAFEIDHYQPLLFIVDSFDHLFSLVDRLEQWMKEGKLNNVAPGEPGVDEKDLKSFLEAVR